MKKDTDIGWIDALSIAGLVAAAYVIYQLFLKASWDSISIVEFFAVIGGLGIGIVSLLLAGTALAAIILATGYPIRLLISRSVIAANRTILTKYLPGKVWYVIGITESLASVGIPRPRAWIVVVLYQVILIITALLLGVVGVGTLSLVNYDLNPILENFKTWKVLGLSLVAVLAFVYFLSVYRKKLSILIGGLGFRWLLIAVLISMIHWILQGVAVWIILSMIHGSWLSQSTILIVPAVYALGFLVLVAPGGMGIRELLFLQYFIHLGMTTDASAGMAIMARVASVGMEISVWILIYIMRYRERISRRQVSTSPNQ